jgi:Heterokaryon incompatibility protein (HET)
MNSSINRPPGLIASFSTPGQQTHSDERRNVQGGGISDTADEEQKCPRLGLMEPSKQAIDGDVNPQQPPPGNELCSQCRDIDFSKLWDQDIRVPVPQNGSFSTCNFCQFFQRMNWGMYEQRRGQDRQTISLLTFGESPLYNRLHQISVMPRIPLPGDYYRYFVCRDVGSPDEAYVRVLQPNNIDFGQIRDWLDFCDQHHTGLCKRSRSIPRLTVIDCLLRRLTAIEELSANYVTLSYVWGNEPPRVSKIQSGEPLEALEKTIEDSMAVATTLGFRYLWVDRYCIPQNNEKEKDSQIELMGDIYANSSLTIIAAAGDNADFGLPGVSSRARKQYPHVRIGSRDLVCLPPRVAEEVKTSVWNTRGWTYQEGLLARRRLLFTESQVYFQCTAMHCEESVHVPIASLHVESLERFRNEFTGLFPRDGIGESSEDILKRIREYVPRRLSYVSDALRAFLGILRAYQLFQSPVRHLCGVVIFQPETFERTKTLTISQMLAFGLTWYSLLPALQRRQDFPSWTWLGWLFHEHKQALISLNLDPKYHDTILFTAEVEIRKGLSCQLQHYTSPCPTNLHSITIPSSLVVRGWMCDIDLARDILVDCHIIITPAWQDTKPTPKIKRMKDIYAFVAHALKHTKMQELDDSKQPGQITALILGTETLNPSWVKVMFLCYRETTQAYERLPFSSDWSRLGDKKNQHVKNLGGLSWKQCQIRLQ